MKRLMAGINLYSDHLVELCGYRKMEYVEC